MGSKHTKSVVRQKLKFLAIEGGGTRSTVLQADHNGQIFDRRVTSPLNTKLLSEVELISGLKEIKRRTGRQNPQALGLFCAGCKTRQDQQYLRNVTEQIWPNIPCIVGNDLESGHAAAFGVGYPGILVISGTGSCAYGVNNLAQTSQVGGWGHLLGDHGSGYWIAMQNLKCALRSYDRNHKLSKTLQHILQALCINTPDELPAWVQTATKSDIAALAPSLIFEDPSIASQAADDLATDCIWVAHSLKMKSPQIAFVGGVFNNNHKFFKLTARKVESMLPCACITRPKHESAIGALLLTAHCASQKQGLQKNLESFSIISDNDQSEDLPSPMVISLTEQRNPRTLNLHKRSVTDLVDTMLAEDARIIPIIRKEKKSLVRVIKAITTAFEQGGRLFYVGAGTSGRLGVLDASECPPTFSTDPQMVQAIIAGGSHALHSAVENAEDDFSAGVDAIRFRGVNRNDIVVGIAASGTTPFVHGALHEAHRKGVKTFLLCCSPLPDKISKNYSPNNLLIIPVGPEVITGSTRLKAGTATKLVLNMLTTISMIRLGKVRSNLMVDLNPTNEKLRTRACRIVANLKGCSHVEARVQLLRHRWNVKSVLDRI